MPADDHKNDPANRMTDPALEAEIARRSGRWGATLPRADERDHLLVRSGTLVVVAGTDVDQEHVSTGEEILVGTNASCDVVLHDAAVSRFHCRVTLGGKSVTVRDLGSANGTLVDGVAVLEAQLKSGAVLTVGRTQLRFDLGGQPVRVPLSTEDRFGRLHGGSVAMRRVYARLQAAPDVAVLFEGEEGTGKATAARSLHEAGPRKAGPFVLADAAAAEEDAFEEARGGTLYLREVAEVPVARQGRLAALAAASPDVRVMAGSRRNLQVEVNARRLAMDLYRRVAGWTCRLPPLREHPEDLPALVDLALERTGGRESERLRTRDVYAELSRHTWPGNVRQLFAFVELASDPRRAPDPDAEVAQHFAAWIAEHEVRLVTEALNAAHGERTAAARDVGVDAARFAALLHRHGLD